MESWYTISLLISVYHKNPPENTAGKDNKMFLQHLFGPVLQHFIPAALSHCLSKALADCGGHTNNGGAEALSITSRRAENSCRTLIENQWVWWWKSVAASATIHTEHDKKLWPRCQTWWFLGDRSDWRANQIQVHCHMRNTILYISKRWNFNKITIQGKIRDDSSPWLAYNKLFYVEGV